MLSHSETIVSLAARIKSISERIRAEGDKPHVTVAHQLDILKQLSEFEFGRFLIQNQGINGYWTHYMLTHPWFGRKTGKNQHGELLHPLEIFLLDRAPTMLATQQRFKIFLDQNQAKVKNGATLGCIPCGMMGELLYLDFKHIDSIQLIGIDYDQHTFKDARALAAKNNLSQWIQLIQNDAWKLQTENTYDLISSNGLNIYEPDDYRVFELYHRFYMALKPGGKLVTSFLTYPPTLTDHCEWELSQLNPTDLLEQRIIFADVLEAKFQHYRSSSQTRMQLESIGFEDVQFIYDDAKIFPTVVAVKK